MLYGERHIDNPGDNISGDIHMLYTVCDPNFWRRNKTHL